MLIHRNVIKSLHPATASDDTRYALGGIYVDPKSGECVATDGHILVRAAKAAEVSAEEYPGKANGATINPSAEVSGLLDANALLDAAKRTPRKPYAPILEHVAVLSRTAFHATDLSQSTTITGQELDGNFPDWRAVISKVPEDANTFTLNADLIATLVKVAKAQGRKPACVTFHVVPKQEHNGVYFTIGKGDSPQVDGVVMPMRI